MESLTAGDAAASGLRLRAARARIAAVVVPPAIAAELGEIRLREDQRRTVARALEALARHGGCVVADDVGRGKTFVALAVARQWRRPLVVVPASLRTTWTAAMRRAGVAGELVSHEALSRGRLPQTDADLVIVDESHRFRTPSTRRYDALAALSAFTPLLLLSATPVQNDRRDLAAQIALFLGERAWSFDDGALAAHVVRGADVASTALPRVALPRWIRPDVDESDVLDTIIGLPAPAQPLDGGDGGVLRTMGLVRAWASSRAALVAMIARRRRTAVALEQAAMEGRRPARRELRAWHGVDGGVQLGFVPMLAESAIERVSALAILEAVHAEMGALARLITVLDAHPDPDVARAGALRALCATHAEQRVLAFSELASTVRAYAAAMRGEPGLGVLTSRDARIASGHLPRDALLARFAPVAQGAAPPPERERVSLLLATDLLSEGVNLQDAGIVVHLDLPWNPARLAQRVGRLRRPGGAPTIEAYLVAPPARAALLLDVESRLRRKLAGAERLIGRALPVVPVLAGEDADPVAPRAASRVDGHATERGALLERIACWRDATLDATHGREDSGAPAIGAAEAAQHGWLAALSDGRLIASVDRSAPSPAMTADAVQLAAGRARVAPAAELEEALRDAARWLAAERLTLVCGLDARLTPLAACIERRVAAVIARAPRHARADIVSLGARLRMTTRAHHALGAERALATLLASVDRAPHSAERDRRWMMEALRIATAGPPRSQATTSEASIVALVVFGPSASISSSVVIAGPGARPA